MKVVHISPTYFDDSSIIGGGERYVSELAVWMSRVADTTLVSFSNERRSTKIGELKVEVYPVKKLIHGSRINPLSFRYLEAILTADVVHLHHINTLVSDVACLVGSTMGKRLFVTDYGGGGSLTLNKRMPVFDGYQGIIVYSKFGLKMLSPEMQNRAILIKGGIDTERFCPNGVLKRENKILFVGRILPHKGIDYLIEGFRLMGRRDFTLRIIGRMYSESYYDYLKELSHDLSVEFIHDADDQRLIHEYRTALATVLPSVHRSYNGSYTSVPELMGFTLLESQACGTPVICTDAGAMSEFVCEGRTGFVVAQNSAEALAGALIAFANDDSTQYSAYQERCTDYVAGLNWSEVVRQHLKAYTAEAGSTEISPASVAA